MGDNLASDSHGRTTEGRENPTSPATTLFARHGCAHACTVSLRACYAVLHAALCVRPRVLVLVFTRQCAAASECVWSCVFLGEGTLCAVAHQLGQSRARSSLP